MAKMDRREAMEIFQRCEITVKQSKPLVIELIRMSGIEEQEINRSEAKSLIRHSEQVWWPLVVSCLADATRASEQAGWWNRKIARTYVKDLSHETAHLRLALQRLSKKLKVA